LLSKNAEIVIGRESFRLEKYDSTLPLDETIKAFEKAGHSEAFLRDLKKGFETSAIYEDKNEGRWRGPLPV